MKNMKQKLCISALSVLLLILLASPVYAYIDPSTTTYIIQSVAAIFIAAGAALGIFWKKIKLHFKKKKMADLERKLAKEGEKRENR